MCPSLSRITIARENSFVLLKRGCEEFTLFICFIQLDFDKLIVSRQNVSS